MSYLSVYNWVQTGLWALGLVLLVGSLAFVELRAYVSVYYIAVQSVMVLDVVNVVLRIVRAALLPAVMQVASRLLMVWYVVPRQERLYVFDYLMFGAWSLAEIIRYQYYERKASRVLSFLRYNAFIVLYPVGVLAGEVPLIYLNYKATGHVFDLVALACYVPGFPFLFVHMLRQRASAKVKAK